MKNKKIGLIIGILIICGILIGVFTLRAERFKKETITAENFDNITERMKELKEDDAYYFSYACAQYMFKDGMASIFSDSDNNDAMYAEIYNKTVGQLVEEGKQLMKDNHTTVEQYRQALKNAGKYQNENTTLTSGTAIENDTVKDEADTAQSTEKTISIGETIQGKDWEITVSEANFSQKVESPKQNNYLATHYEVKDADNTFLYIVLDCKNISTSQLNTDTIAKVDVKYNDTYNYTSFSAKADELGFSQYSVIKPLMNDKVYFLAEMPNSISTETGTPVDIHIEFENQKYICKYR